METAHVLAKDTKTNGTVASSTGGCSPNNSKNFVAGYSKRRKKCLNQDASSYGRSLVAKKMRSFVAFLTDMDHVDILWQESYSRTCAAVDQQLQQYSGIGSFYMQWQHSPNIHQTGIMFFGLRNVAVLLISIL